ncbi:MAG: Phospho-N-acetylmuramoyl-pentapeptide-transferase [candidate division WS2 bacterium]|nr:Phospho-N-acetylmuramoyl-pentapeptide-transferase [Candidatus Lithacetigena glycinireducens]MBT9174825.1 Phospho-N-acetylmuramoyl-pentapeptide-transferase [Candidatus Lithacetigena glycinireducens]
MVNIILAFLMSFCLYPIYIAFANKIKLGQKIREQGPAHHQIKKGVPTGGGIIFSLVIFVFGLVLNIFPWQFWFLTMGYLLIGLLDDITKIFRKNVLGLRAREKIILQVLFLLPFLYYLFQKSSLISLPGGLLIEAGYLYLLWGALVILATANAYNFLDGLDGLASGVGFIIFFFLWLSYQLGFVAGNSIGIEIIIGSSLAFLWFNTHPAQVIMGDAGALFTGAYLAGIFLMDRREVLLPVFGFILVATLLSVVIQVIYFRLTGGRRIFRMSPLHHHFELMGLSETKIVGRYWIFTFLFCLIGLLLSRLR